MNRYFLEIAYRGTNYAGWQVQQNKTTVQGIINSVISKILRENIICTGSGRTDAGVHALQTYAHFDTQAKLPKNLIYRLNQILPKDIVINNIIPVHADAHARYDAIERSYKYYIHFKKDPFLEDSSYFFPNLPIDLEQMQIAVELIKTFKDFAPLSKANDQLKNTLCEIYECSLEKMNNNKGLIFSISANRFLHNMVRRIVGLLLMIGKNKITIDEFTEVMSSNKRLKINISAPPQGLYLFSVKYPYITT